MVRLKNIKIEENYAEADFYPEASEKCGHIVVDLKDEEIIQMEPVPGYGEGYGAYARRRLVQMAKDGDKRTECLVMWY